MAPNEQASSLVRPVSNVTLSEQVANQIIDMISANRWKPGQKLPSESELCEAFRVGRSTLREALKSLAFSGFVRMRAGEGTYVMESPPLFGRIRRNGIGTQRDLWYVIETRFALESRTAGLCAERASDEDLVNLEHLVDDMQRCLNAGAQGFLERDIEFHIAIAAASKNPILHEFMLVLREPVLHLMYALKSSGINRAQNEHYKILEAVKERNPRSARRAMNDHLRTYWRRGLVLLKPE